MEFLDCYRVCIDVPEEALEGFIAAVSPHVPSFLGNYDHVCRWDEKGIEQSRRKPDGQVDRVECRRFECVLPADERILKHFIETVVRSSHPWQEPTVTVIRQKIAKFG